MWKAIINLGNRTLFVGSREEWAMLVKEFGQSTLVELMNTLDKMEIAA